MKYILIYNIDDFHENGGGVVYEESKDFSEKENIIKRINELAVSYGSRFEFITAGSLYNIEIFEETVITKFKAK